MTQAEDAARDPDSFRHALLTGTVSRYCPEAIVAWENIGPTCMRVRVSFADGSSWHPFTLSV